MDRESKHLPTGLLEVLPRATLAMFDFDGTLAYTQGKNVLIYEQVFGELGVTGVTEEEYAAMIGHPVEEHVRHIASCHGLPMGDAEVAAAARRFIEIADEWNAAHVPGMFPYVPEALSLLADARCLVVTANDAGHVGRILRSWGVGDAFSGIVSVGGPGARGTKLDAYRREAGALLASGDPSRAVVFEDSEQSVGFAKSLGMLAVRILHPRSGDASGTEADFVIDMRGEC